MAETSAEARNRSEKMGFAADERRTIVATRDRAPAAAQPLAGAAPGSDASGIIVSGTRIGSRRSIGVPAESAVSNIVVTGTRVAAARRGDWNACTVDDPGRSLAECRKRLSRAAKGEASAHLAEGLGHAWGGETVEAIAAFDRAIASAPTSAFAYLNRGLARRRSGDLARALADLDRAVKYAPGEARNYYSRSLVLRQQGATTRARRDEERAVELDPAYAGVVR
jgi:tetratricopeptide (TPR) repeat protein